MTGIAPAKSADAYARHLAGYISNPSTVRARTMEEFGNAPELDTISRWCEYFKSERAQPADEFDDDDLVGAVVAEVPPVRTGPVFDVPPWIMRPKLSTDMIAEVARSFELTVEDLRSPSREAYIVRVRSLVVRLLTDHGHSTPVIGRWMHRDHSTILHSRDRFPEIEKRTPAIAEAYAHFRREWGIERETEQ